MKAARRVPKKRPKIRAQISPQADQLIAARASRRQQGSRLQWLTPRHRRNGRSHNRSAPTAAQAAKKQNTSPVASARAGDTNEQHPIDYR